jgi:dihydrofolate reductase
MRKLTVINHMTLDGVMQAPGRPDEDTRGGFSRGGWAQAGNDEVMASFMAAGRGGDPVALVLGRRTYLDFAGFWPRQPDNPYTEALTKQQKYVASRTLAEPLPWENSTLLRGDAAAAVAALKQEPGPDLLVLGSGELIQSLRQRALVDEYVLMIHPLILGPGRRLFPALPGALTTDRMRAHTEEISAMRLMPAGMAWCRIKMSGFTGNPELRLTGVKRHDYYLAGHVGQASR